jgi:hypothetical protein
MRSDFSQFTDAFSIVHGLPEPLGLQAVAVQRQNSVTS